MSVNNDQNNSNSVLKVGEIIKPINPAGLVSNLMLRLYGMKVTDWKELVSYDDRNFLVNVTNEHQNPNMVDDIDPKGYLLKVYNLKISQNSEYIDALYNMMDFVRKKGVPTPKRIANIDGTFSSKQKIYTDLDDPSCTEFLEYVVILQTFIPGSTLDHIPLTPSFIYKCGKFIGSLDTALKDFYHPYFDTYETIWSLKSIPKLVDFCYVIEDNEKRCVVDEIIAGYKCNILPLFSKFQKGQIHGDLNLFNILAEEKPLSAIDNIPTTGSNKSLNPSPEKEYNLCGVIDFADSTYSFPVFDLAILISYSILECKLDNPLEAGGHLLAGYLTEFELNPFEKEALPLLVCARLLQSLVMARYSYSHDQTNEYTLDTEKKNGWPLLFQLWKHPMKELYDFWKQIADSYI